MKPFALNSPDDGQAIEAQAAAWIIEEESGLTPEHTAAFACWCRQDPRHQAAVNRLRAAFGNLQRLRDYRPGARVHPDPDLLAPTPRRRVIAPIFAAAAAVTVIVIGIIAFSSAGHYSGFPWADSVRYVTDASGFNRTSLPDGSVMELNSDTEVRVRFSRDRRLVRLLHGEGHFVVAPEADRPFVVEASGLQVRAIGTEFNVRSGHDAVEVLVTHGRVKLAAARGAGLLGSDPPILGAGQRAVVADPEALGAGRSSSLSIEDVSLEEVRAALAWQNPRLHFVDATLAEAVRQFNQRNLLQISLADPELGRIPVGGSFRPENVEGFVRLLASANEVTVERPAPNRITLRRPARR